MPAPLRYPAALTAFTLAVGAAFFVVASSAEQRSAIAVVLLGVVLVSAYHGMLALRPVPAGSRVRQQHRLVSRSWIESESGWIPVYFDPAVITGDDVRLYRSGPTRSPEPAGRLIDNPSRPSADAAELAFAATRWRRRLTLDAQHAVAAPLVGFLWVYVDGGGLTAFLGATCLAAVVATWLPAIRGSDPS